MDPYGRGRKAVTGFGNWLVDIGSRAGRGVRVILPLLGFVGVGVGALQGFDAWVWVWIGITTIVIFALGVGRVALAVIWTRRLGAPREKVIQEWLALRDDWPEAYECLLKLVSANAKAAKAHRLLLLSGSLGWGFVLAGLIEISSDPNSRAPIAFLLLVVAVITGIIGFRRYSAAVETAEGIGEAAEQERRERISNWIKGQQGANA